MMIRHAGNGMTRRALLLSRSSKSQPAISIGMGEKLRFKSTKPDPSHQDGNSSSGGGLFGSANDYLSTLRWKAANALTSSLPPEEQSKLLESVSKSTQPTSSSSSVNLAKPKEIAAEAEDDSHVPEQSIAEAVAAARAQEAQLQEAKWERERDQLVQEAEEAARKRIESDLAIQKRRLAFEAWKRDLESSQQENKAVSETVAQTAQEEHPVLGPALVDLGHKRIHLVSAKALAAIPVWKKQRIYRHSRAKSMATDKAKSMQLGLPGIIGIFEDKNGFLSILDGQHRVGMLQVLQEKEASGDFEFDFDKILVEVYPHQGEGDGSRLAQDIFLEVNKAEPVKLVDLPGIATKKDRNIINDGAQRLNDAFPDMFKPSQRCRPPHLNIDNLRDALFASNAIAKHSLTTPKALEKWMMEQNQELANKYEQEEFQKQVSVAALKKAQQYNFYLGLDSSWLYA